MSEWVDPPGVRRPASRAAPVLARAEEDDCRLRQILAGLEAGSVAAVGDLFDLFGADVWRAALVGAREPELAEAATVDTFRAAWHRPTSVPDTTVAARRWMLTTAVELSRDLAAEGAQR